MLFLRFSLVFWKKNKEKKPRFGESHILYVGGGVFLHLAGFPILWLVKGLSNQGQEVPFSLTNAPLPYRGLSGPSARNADKACQEGHTRHLHVSLQRHFHCFATLGRLAITLAQSVSYLDGGNSALVIGF